MVSGTEENKEYYFKRHKNADEKYEGDDPNVVHHGLQGRKVDHVRQEYDHDISLISNC